MAEANCIISTDDESYTYNKRVNHIPPVSQHFMLLKAIKSGLTKERIASALNIDTGTLQKRVHCSTASVPKR